MQIMDIIDRIKKMIIDSKMSELGLSSKIGIPQRSVNYYLSRKQKPSLEFISKIVETFNIDANWLLTGNGDMEISSTSSEINTDYKEKYEKLEKENLILRTENDLLREMQGLGKKQTAS